MSEFYVYDGDDKDDDVNEKITIKNVLEKAATTNTIKYKPVNTTYYNFEKPKEYKNINNK